MIVRKSGTRATKAVSKASLRGDRDPNGKQRDRSHLEIQIHPGDIRKRVRYLFISRRKVATWAGVVALYAALLILAAAIAPGVFRSLLSRKEYQALQAEQKVQGKRLSSITGRLGLLEGRSDELRLKLSKILLAYGLSTEESIGQGGYPFDPSVPESLSPRAGEGEAAMASPQSGERPSPDRDFDALRAAGSIFEEPIEQGLARTSQLREQAQVLSAFLEEVHFFEGAHRAQVRTTPAISPLIGDDFVLTSTFGTRRDPFTKQNDFHAGIDLAAPVGKEIRAPADGVVSFAGRYPANRSVGWWRYGKLVILRHGGDFVTLFAHCDELLVRRGQQVSQGDPLATVGNTGWSTGPHLHYEVRRRNGEGDLKPVDPRIYILDHRWKNEELLLARATSSPVPTDYQPLPSLAGGR